MQPTDAALAAVPEQTLADLRARLLAAGYTPDGVLELLGPDAAAALVRGERVPARRAATGADDLALLVRLLLLGGAEDAGRVAGLGLTAPFVVASVDGATVSAAVDLRPYGEDGYVCSDLVVGPAGVAGVGPASVTLLQATVARPTTGRALDLGTGCGVQALHLAQAGAAVVATDVSPRGLAYARLTLRLSGVAGVDLRAGDLLAPVAGEQFDLVVANPPFVVGPVGRERFVYRDGGLDGDGLTAHLIATVGSHLAPGGVAQLLANWVRRPGEDWRDRVGGWLPAGLDAYVVQREVADPAAYIGLWLRDALGDGTAGPGPAPDAAFEEQYGRWLDWFAAAGADGVGFGIVTLRRPVEPGEPARLLTDLRQPLDAALGPEIGRWLDVVATLRRTPVAELTARAVPGLRREDASVASADGWLPLGSELVEPAGVARRVEIDDLGLALVAGCDGVAPLGAVAARAASWARQPTDVALGIARALLERGLLRVVETSDLLSPSLFGLPG